MVTHPHPETNEIYFERNSSLSCVAKQLFFSPAGKGNINFPLCCGTAGHAAYHVTTTLCQRPTGRDCRGDVTQIEVAGTRVSCIITPD